MLTLKEMNEQLLKLKKNELAHMDSYLEYCENHKNDNKFDYISEIVLGEKYLYGKKVVAMDHDRFSPPNYHAHKFMELTYILEGDFLNIIEGQEIIMHKGDVCIIPPPVFHSIDLIERDCEKRADSYAINIFIRADAIAELFGEAKNESFVRFINGIVNSENHRKFAFFVCSDPSVSEQLVRLLYYSIKCGLESDTEENTLLSESITKSLIAELLSRERYSIVFSSSFYGNSSGANDIIEYVYRNYKTVTLEDVAAKFNYSFSYASKLIKQRTGLGFSKMLSNIRLEKACEMLAGTEQSVHSIASECGYNNIEHFHRSFRAKYNITPSSYREISRSRA